jgi:hypothetical protein
MAMRRKVTSYPLSFTTYFFALDNRFRWQLVMTLILKKYRQSSNKFRHRVLRLIRMPAARYCLIVELVRVRSSIDS